MKKHLLRTLITALMVGAPLAQANELKGDFIVQTPDSPECQSLVDFSTQQGKIDKKYVSSSRGELAPLKTDSIVIEKDGQTKFEWYDGVYKKNTPHVLWSASKMITATLIGRTIFEETYYQTENGPERVSLQTKLKTFFPNPGLLKKNPEMKEKYDQITLENLVDMSANFTWNEFYDGDLTQSTFMPMLYLYGHQNMAEYALSQPMNPEGPGNRWNYSGGNVNILMAVLEKIHGKPTSIVAKELLFEPLGLESAKAEVDDQGRIVGSSYFYMSPTDLIKVGNLYLNKGVSDRGIRLLSSSWISEAQQLTPAVYSKATTLDYIKLLGAQSRRVFWLNQNITRDDGTFKSNPDTGEVIKDARTGEKLNILYPQEMPEVPNDMYFAAGHYGQILIIIPSEKLVIARTGYDLKYWDHIQPLITKTLQCLKSEYKPKKLLSNTIVPPSAGPKKSGIEKAFGFLKDAPVLIKSIHYVRTVGLAASIISKEMCSFLYTMKAENTVRPENFVSEYFKRSGLPGFALKVLTADLKVDYDQKRKTVSVSQYGYVTDDTYQIERRQIIKTITSQQSDASDLGCRIVQQENFN